MKEGGEQNKLIRYSTISRMEAFPLARGKHQDNHQGENPIDLKELTQIMLLDLRCGVRSCILICL